jgi:hypothetical protein
MGKYKKEQKVDIGDGGIWKIIGYEDGLIEIELISQGDHLFIDESEIVRLIEE